MKILKIGLLIFASYGALVYLMYLLQEKFIFQGSSLPKDYQFDLPNEFEEVFINAKDGATLHGVLLKSPNPKGVILYFHGNRKNIIRWGKEASYFTQYDYDVLVMDYRGYGKSYGPRSESLLHQDAESSYEYLLKRYSKEKVIVYGRSLGTGIATRLASKYQINKLLLETPYHNFGDMIFSRLMVLPSKRFMNYKFNSIEYINKVTCPVFIFHGTDDQVIPLEYGKMLAEAGDEKLINFIVIEAGSHNDLNTFDAYNKAMREIL